ncbi:MAG: electron transport complex subunit RsxC [Ignavibacteriaceae bacterium]|nr:electron transport complex subunit RsxC [Ignavibacteriaceae bacterium]
MFTKISGFSGGVHPEESKELTAELPIETIPLPKTVIIPLSQHIGKPALPLVKKGAVVQKGEVIAEMQGVVSVPVHASVSGTVTKINVNPHLSGSPKEAIEITASEEQTEVRMDPLDPGKINADEIRERIKMAGLVGQGGAAFPTYVKLSPPPDKKIDLLIINAAECEPYLTRDYRLIIERTSDFITGVKLLMKAAGVEKGIIGIEDNKPKAIEVLRKALSSEKSITLAVAKTKYPQGAEKMLIYVATGRKVPPGKLPMDVGVIVQNVGTSVAVFDAIVNGLPQTTATITVTGRGIKNPKNLIVPVGTQIKTVLEHCGGLTEDAAKVIAGGPMMGIPQYELNAPVLKATSGLLILNKKEARKSDQTACLRCGKCIDVCPLNLLPTKLARLSQLEKYEDAEALGVTVCMECGSCAFECPANIPLVQWIKLGKQQVFKIQRARQKA